jgi:hypothetical protein
VAGAPHREVPMTDYAQNRILFLGAVAAAVILALVFLQSVSNKPIRGDYDLPPPQSGSADA